MAIWDDILTGTDRDVFEVWMQNAHKELGKRPAIIVVDTSYAFVGPKSMPILKSIAVQRGSCGEAGWTAVAHIQELLSVGRERGIPIIYSTVYSNPRQGAGWANRARDRSYLELVGPEEFNKRQRSNTIVKEIEPQHGDLVITKRAPSVFNGTSLASQLNEMDVDTIIVAGGTTSGCVRATVVDGASANYYVGIVQECVFDRFVISHKVNLMDMHAKYGTVISLTECLEYLRFKAEPVLRAKQLASA